MKKTQTEDKANSVAELDGSAPDTKRAETGPLAENAGQGGNENPVSAPSDETGKSPDPPTPDTGDDGQTDGLTDCQDSDPEPAGPAYRPAEEMAQSLLEATFTAASSIASKFNSNEPEAMKDKDIERYSILVRLFMDQIMTVQHGRFIDREDVDTSGYVLTDNDKAAKEVTSTDE